MFDLMTAIRSEKALRGERSLLAAAIAPKVSVRVCGNHQEVACAPLSPDVVLVDVETYVEQGYSLQTYALSEYIRDPRFKILGVGVSYQGRRHWLSESEFRERAQKTPWQRLTVVAHNAQFDAAVLAWCFGIEPARWADTLAMARGAYPQLPEYSLAALAERFKLGKKLDTLASLAGIRDLSDAQDEVLRQYNENDLVLLERLYAELAPNYPAGELDLIDRTVRQCTEPCLVLDKDVLEAIGESMAEKRSAELAMAGVAIEDLRSAPRFAERLAALGVPVPQKISPRTGKMTFALSIKDPEFAALKTHPDQRVQDLVRARMNATSNMTASRAATLRSLADLGPLPVELNYYGAATGRFSGGGGINLQNLPRGSALRQAICAPAGHVLVGCDSAQIEARILAWFAGQQDLLDAFRANRDVYCEFAAVFFARTITKADSAERQVGKTAILGLGYGMGASKFADNLKASQIDLPEGDVARLVKTYRNTYKRIPMAWRAAQQAVLANGPRFGKLNLSFRDERILLPNGLSLHYPGLQQDDGQQWRYNGRRGRDSLYGGKIIENVIQALARIVVMEQQQIIAREFRVVFSVHDEIVCCVPAAMADACRQRLLSVMATPPAWASGLPLACEAAAGQNYAEI
jgi:DNA polymerase